MTKINRTDPLAGPVPREFCEQAPASAIVLPDGAEHLEILTKEDGSTVIRWFEPCCDDDSHGEFWWVTQSADRRTVDIDHFTPEPSYTDRVFDTLKCLLQYQSGVNVNYCNQVAP